jgi:hypothetical protein
VTDEIILEFVLPMARLLDRLTVRQRLLLLATLLTQEVCHLPPGDRDAAMAEVMGDLPSLLVATEEGMRDALSMNAKRGL